MSDMRSDGKQRVDRLVDMNESGALVTEVTR